MECIFYKNFEILHFEDGEDTIFDSDGNFFANIKGGIEQAEKEIDEHIERETREMERFVEEWESKERTGKPFYLVRVIDTRTNYAKFYFPPTYNLAKSFAIDEKKQSRYLGAKWRVSFEKRQGKKLVRDYGEVDY